MTLFSKKSSKMTWTLRFDFCQFYFLTAIISEKQLRICLALKHFLSEYLENGRMNLWIRIWNFNYFAIIKGNETRKCVNYCYTLNLITGSWHLTPTNQCVHNQQTSILHPKVEVTLKNWLPLHNYQLQNWTYLSIKVNNDDDQCS